MEFKYRAKKKEETVTEYGFAITRLVNSAYPRLPFEAREVMALERFIDGLPSIEMQKHVEFGHPQSMDQAVALATEFESFNGRFHGRKPEDRPVRSIGKEEGEVLKVLKEIAKGQQSLANQLQSQVPSHVNPPAPSYDGAPLICYNCYLPGHMAKNCRNPRSLPRPNANFSNPPPQPRGPPQPQASAQSQNNGRVFTPSNRRTPATAQPLLN